MKKIILIVLAAVFILSGCNKTADPKSTDVRSNGELSKDLVHSYTDYMDEVIRVNKEEEKTVLKVNDREITNIAIDLEVLADYESVKNSLSQIEEIYSTEEEKTEERKKYQYKTKEEIIQKIIRNTVQEQEAERRGIESSYENALEYAKESYNLLIEDMNNREEDKKMYEDINKYIEEMGYSSIDEYLDEEAKVFMKLEMITKLKSQVTESFSEKQKQNAEEEYEKFVDSLVKSAKIEYLE